ncbi:MAG: DsbA family protein [Campylobacteraceae bacterium]|nr:DsbA family protein [Campylobacteraceae bacterium]
MKNTLYYIYDPMCSWCYAFSKTFKILKEKLSNDINIVYIAGGLAANTDEPMQKEMALNIENIWKTIEKQTNTSFNYDFWKNNTPKRSTYLSCQAVIAAKLQNKESEMLEKIQEFYYLKALNPSNEDILTKAALEINLDINKFKIDLYSKEVENLLLKDFKKRDSLSVRSFPSLVLQYKKEAYPINISFDDTKGMINQINDLSTNVYF